MKKRTSSMSRRIVSLLMSMVLTLTLVTPAAFATEVVGGSGTAIVEGDTNPADANPSGDNEGKDDENKDTEHGGDEQPTNPGDEDKNPGEGEGDDANKPDEDKKDEAPDGENKDEENKNEQPTEEPTDEIDTQEGEGTDPVAVEPNIEWYMKDKDVKKFTISSAADLLGLAQLVNGEAKETAEDGTTKNIGAINFSDCEIVLANDIDLSTVCHPADESGAAEVNWTPIGNDASHAFAGTFDGDGHTISNLYISLEQKWEKAAKLYQGLLGNVSKDGIVQNLIVTGSVAVTNSVNKNVTYVGGIVGGNSGTVQNCGFYGTVQVKKNLSTNVTVGNGGVSGPTGSVINCWYVYKGSVPSRYQIGVAGGTATNCYQNAYDNANAKGTYKNSDSFKGIEVVMLLNDKRGDGKAWKPGAIHPEFLGADEKLVVLEKYDEACTANVEIRGTADMYTVISDADVITVTLARTDDGVDKIVCQMKDGTVKTEVTKEGTAVPISAGINLIYYGTEENFNKIKPDTTWYSANKNATITTKEQLAGLAKLVNDGTFKAETVALGADIDLSGYVWIPIGTKKSPFKGTFKGGQTDKTGKFTSYAISGLNGDLFGVVESGNNKLAAQYVTIDGGTGRLVNELKSGKVENCMSTAEVTKSADGGLVGTVVAGATVFSSYYYNGKCKDTPVVGSGKATNCFYLAETSTFGSTAGENGENGDTGARTAEEFASGQVACELTANGTTSYWGQTASEQRPKLSTTDTVYKVVLKMSYASDELKDVTVKAMCGDKSGSVLYVNSGAKIAFEVNKNGIDSNIHVAFNKTLVDDTYTIAGWDNPEIITCTVSKDTADYSWYYDKDEQEYKSSPYEIKTEEQLLAFAALVNGTANLSSITGENTVATRSDNFSGKTVQVADNIELSAATAWTPVGDASGKAFSGTFDGKEHTISGLTDSLFGYVQNGTLQNIVLGVSINKSAITAGLVLYLKGQSIIRDCTVSGIVEVTERSASGIVYSAEAGSKIEHCVNNAKITITNGSNTMYAGGIVAVFNGSELKFCQNSGTIAGPVAGGIIGNRITKGGDIRNCLNTGEIKGTAYAGGIIGLITVAEEGTADQPFAVDNCRNEAVVTVSGTNAYAGGVIGFSDTNAWQSAKVTAVNLANIGAVTAENGTAGGVIGGKTEIGNKEVVLVLHNSYNRGTVTGSQAYGLSGAGDITNSYYACRVNAEDKVSYVDKNSIEQSVSTTNYKVGETDETLVDTLNANRGTALAWFVNPEKDVKWPIFAVKWNGDKDENSPLAAIKVTYDANGGEGGYVDVVYTPADTDGKPTECTYTVLGIADTGIISDNGTFVTWNETQSGGESGSHTPGSTMEFTGDNTLYAQWDAIWAGTGTESDPYQISDAEKLTALQTQVNDEGFNYKGKYFALTPENKTIALTGKWTPIGNGNTSFGGSIEGNGTTITGLQVSEEWYAGLFRLLGVDGTSTYIRNLTISGDVTAEKGHAGGLTAIVGNGTITLENITTEVTVTSHGDANYALPFGSAGGLIGYNVANNGAAYNVVKVINCTNKGNISGATAGGIAGANNDPNAASQYTLEDCTNKGSVTGLLYAGGILGGSTNSTATRCENSGTVKATGTTGTRGYAGGICATNLRWAKRCVNTGEVCGQYAGGIAYGLSSTYGGEAKYCLNKGNITGTRIAAGIVAYGKSEDISGIGGISFSYNLGKVTADAGKGAAERAYGIASSGNIKNCFTYNEAKHVAISASNELVTNSYYLADSAGEFSTAYGGEWASADDFASGKVAWGVGGKGEGSQGGTGQDAQLGWWKQDKDDKYPTLLPTPDMSKRYYRTDVDCGTGGEVELTRNASNTVKELSSKEAVYGPAGTSVTIKATPKDNTFGLKSLTWTHNGQTDVLPTKGTTNIVMPAESNVTIRAEFASVGGGGGGYYYGGSGDGTGTGDKDDEGLQDGLNMDVEYNIKGLVLGAYAEWGANGGNKSFQKWLEENPNVVRALLTNSLDNMATAAVGKKTDEAKDLAALLLASLNEHTGVDSKDGDTIAKALQKYIGSGSEEVFSAWLTGGGGMASGTYESIYGQYASSLAALADRLYSKWEASGTSMTFPVWLDAQQVSMDSLSENAEEPDTDSTNDPQTSDAPDDVPDGQDTEGGASGNSVWEIIGTVVRENPIIVWSIVAVIAALIIVGAVRRYHKVKRDERDDNGAE